MEVWASKAVAAVALGAGSLAAGLAPACCVRRGAGVGGGGGGGGGSLGASCLLCAGGGVLLATALLHVLPEARDQLPLLPGGAAQLPLAELALCLGFLIVYVADELVHWCCAGGDQGGGCDSSKRYGTAEATPLLPAPSAPTVRPLFSHEPVPSAPEDCDDELCGGEDGETPRMCHVSHAEPCRRGAAALWALLVALLLHSLLEGLAIGMQDTAAQVWMLLGAVSAHKLVVAWSLGAELASSAVGARRLITAVLAFSAGGAAGVALGAGLNRLHSLEDTLIVPILQGVSAGSLVYVTVSEVLPRERARWHQRSRRAPLAQLASFLLGFLAMLPAILLLHD